MNYKPYSARNGATQPDSYIYDVLPEKLRNQIKIIVGNAIGYDQFVDDDTVEDIYCNIWEAYELEHGKLDVFHDSISCKWRVLETIKEELNLLEVLDMIELCFRLIQRIGELPDPHMEQRNATLSPNKAVNELNARFKQNNIGYQFRNGQLIKLSNELLHTEIVIEVTNLLMNPMYVNANEEYMKGQEHFKNGFNKECLNECLKALESTLKIIFTHKGWAYNTSDTLGQLITVAYTNNLIPEYIQTHLGSIRAVLTSGVNSIRNKVGGHGQGPVPIMADDETTRFTLNLTGSYIIYLVELSEL
jgi:hypothetical protein